MSDGGPGVRVWPYEFTQKAKELLDDGTEEGARACRECVARAFGKPYDVIGVPNDMSKGAVRKMLAVKAGWTVEVRHPKMMKARGVKKWRVLAPPDAPAPPGQLTHRGHLIMIEKAEPPKRKEVVVRKPRANQQRVAGAKGGGKGSGERKAPRWVKGWEEKQQGPAWAQRSYASVAAAAAHRHSDEEGEARGAERDVGMEEEEWGDPAEDGAEDARDVGEEEEAGSPGSPGGGVAPKKVPKPKAGGGAACSSTGSSTSPAGKAGRREGLFSGMSKLEAQLEALMPSLIKLVEAQRETERLAQPAAGGVPAAGAPGGKSGDATLKPGEEGYRAPVTVGPTEVVNQQAANRSRAAAAAEVSVAERKKLLEEKRLAGGGAAAGK